jgi:hypothetical protein
MRDESDAARGTARNALTCRRSCSECAHLAGGSTVLVPGSSGRHLAGMPCCGCRLTVMAGRRWGACGHQRSSARTRQVHRGHSADRRCDGWFWVWLPHAPWRRARSQAFHNRRAPPRRHRLPACRVPEGASTAARRTSPAALREPLMFERTPASGRRQAASVHGPRGRHPPSTRVNGLPSSRSRSRVSLGPDWRTGRSMQDGRSTPSSTADRSRSTPRIQRAESSTRRAAGGRSATRHRHPCRLLPRRAEP